MSNYIVLLSDLSYELGIIGLAEYEDRLTVAGWLSRPDGESLDPRGDPPGEPDAHPEPREPREDLGSPDSSGGPDGEAAGSADDDRLMRFIAFNTWVFTIGDRDCYPSVPHGHWLRKTTPWPKLNPYVGRVFASMHQEEVRRRLTRSEMKQLWRDDGFIAHCRIQVLWYSDFAPRYEFPLARRGKLRFPRW